MLKQKGCRVSFRLVAAPCLQLPPSHKEDLKELITIEARIKTLAFFEISSAVDTLTRHLAFVIIVRWVLAMLTSVW